MIRFDPGNPKGIVWLASFPRSGNTWTRLFFSRLLLGTRPADLNRRNEYEASDSDPGLYEQLLGRPVTSIPPQEVAATRPQVQRYIVEKANGLVFIKTHNANLSYLGAPLISQNLSAGAIYVVRNPLDVAVSFAAFRGTSVDRAIADMGTPDLGSPTRADHVFWASGSWSRNVASWTARPDPAVLVVRYEDMLASPLQTFTTITAHIGLAATSQDEIAQAVDGSSFSRLQALEKKTGFREKPDTAERFFREGRSGQWREALTEKQVRRIVGMHGEQMRRFGYLPD